MLTSNQNREEIRIDDILISQNRFWSGREDLNLRPLAPHASTLPGCATPRKKEIIAKQNQT